MGNFLQDVGRSTFQGSIKDMIQTKLNVDQDERLGVAAANASALSAEQLIQTKRANEVAAEKVKYDNVPLPVSVLADSFEGGAEGPIFKYAYNKFRGMGLIDETNPNNPTVLRKHANEYGQKMFTDNAPEINNIRLDWLNQNKKAIQQELLKKPDNEQLRTQLESINTKIIQATMHDDGLKKMAELKNAADIQTAHDVKAKEVAEIQAAATIRGHQISAEATRDVAKEKRLNESSKTSMERAWNIKRSEPGSEDLSLEDFKKNYWEKDKPTGELTDNSALKLITDTLLMAGKDPSEIARVNKVFFKYKKQGLSAGEAYQKALDDYGGLPVPSGAKPPGTKDMSYLWK